MINFDEVTKGDIKEYNTNWPKTPDHPYGISIIGYQKVINLFDNTLNKPSKSRTKNWVEINDDSHGTCNTNSQIKYKTMILKSSLRSYSDAYILVSGTITIIETEDGAPARHADERNKEVILKIVHHSLTS